MKYIHRAFRQLYCLLNVNGKLDVLRKNFLRKRTEMEGEKSNEKATKIMEGYKKCDCRNKISNRRIRKSSRRHFHKSRIKRERNGK